MTKLSTALEFRAMGIATIPLRHRGKEPESGMMGGTWERYKTQLPTGYQIRNWLFSDWQNYGVIAGWNNLAIIDIDNPDALAVWLDYFAMINKHVEVVPQPYMVQTRRGAHIYVKLFGNYNNQKRQGVDVKVHGYVVGPWSTHPSGAVYTPITTEYQFPEIFDLNTLLPVELFPHVAVPAVPIAMPQMAFTLQSSPQEDYDPFAVASTMVTDDKKQGVGGEDLITKVKSYVRIENLFPDAFPTSGDRRWLACKCPFHDDHKPSFWIDTLQQLCGCQVCAMPPMDAINLYSRMHNMDVSASVSAMAKEVGVWG